MDWGGIIAGAIGGGAQAVGNIARDQRLLDNSQALAKFQSDLDVDKAQRVAELQQQMDLKKFDTSTPDSYGSKAIAFDSAKTKATEGVRTDAEVERETKLAPVKQQNAVAQANALADAEANRMKSLAKDPGYMAALRSLKAAQESSASLAQAALTRLQVSKFQGDQALLDELAKARASGSEDAIQAAQQKITDRAFTGKDTAKAYGAYQSAQTKLIDLEMKLNDPTKMLEPAAVASIKQEIQEARLVQKQAMKDMNLPKAGATPTTPLSAFNPKASGPGQAGAAPGIISSAAMAPAPAQAPPPAASPPGLTQGMYPGQEQKDLMDLDDARKRLAIAQAQLTAAGRSQDAASVPPYAGNVARLQAEVNRIESKYKPGYLDSIRTK